MKLSLFWGEVYKVVFFVVFLGIFCSLVWMGRRGVVLIRFVVFERGLFRLGRCSLELFIFVM